MNVERNILDSYQIPVVGLSLGKHEYSFHLDDSVFAYFGHPDVEKGDVTAKVQLDKRPNVIELQILLNGKLTVQCDRCLELFDFPIQTAENIICTIGKQEGCTDEEIVVLTKEQTNLDVSTFLYEIAVTQLPISKVHPNDGKGKSMCNPEMLKILDKYIIREETSPAQKLGDLL